MSESKFLLAGIAVIVVAVIGGTIWSRLQDSEASEHERKLNEIATTFTPVQDPFDWGWAEARLQTIGRKITAFRREVGKPKPIANRRGWKDAGLPPPSILVEQHNPKYGIPTDLLRNPKPCHAAPSKTATDLHLLYMGVFPSLAEAQAKAYSRRGEEIPIIVDWTMISGEVGAKSKVEVLILRLNGTVARVTLENYPTAKCFEDLLLK